MPYFELGSSKYYYYERLPNNADKLTSTIVFVHGAGGHGGEWVNQLYGIGSSCRVVAPDLPGHGKSGGKVCGCIEDYREFISRFIGMLGNDRFYLAGHSMGGAIVLDYALRQPKMLAGIILFSTSARFKAINAVLHLVKSVWENNELVKEDFSICKDFDVANRLVDIQIPALVAVGTDDVLTPLKYSRRLVNGLPDAKLVEISGAGHMVMLDKPEIVNECIVEFVSKRTNYTKRHFNNDIPQSRNIK